VSTPLSWHNFRVLISTRPVSYGTSRLLLLALGSFQLGCSLPNFQFDPISLHHKSPIQYPAKWRRLCRYCALPLSPLLVCTSPSEWLMKPPAMCIGAILSTILSIYQEKIAMHYGKMSLDPEGRLYFSCIQSALLPIGLFWFGWTQFSHIPWIVPTIAIGCATMGIFSIYLAVFNYLADTYHRYASSALAAQSFCMFPYIVAVIWLLC